MQSRNHLFKVCPEGGGAKESGRIKHRFTIRDLLADEVHILVRHGVYLLILDDRKDKAP